jgi:hypothetical protein
MRATVAFLAERLHVAVPDFKDVAELEKGTEDSRLVVPGGRVMDLPGFKSAYAYLEDELSAAVKKARSAGMSDDEIRTMLDLILEENN